MQSKRDQKSKRVRQNRTNCQFLCWHWSLISHLPTRLRAQRTERSFAVSNFFFQICVSFLILLWHHRQERRLQDPHRAKRSAVSTRNHSPRQKNANSEPNYLQPRMETERCVEGSLIPSCWMQHDRGRFDEFIMQDSKQTDERDWGQLFCC